MARTRKFDIVKAFSKGIPKEIRNDVDYIIEETGKDGKERSITLCNVLHKNKIQTGGYSVGSHNSTTVEGCNQQLGKSIKVGDVHTHEDNPETPKLTPSVPDFIGTAADSKNTRIRQISCIGSDGAKMIHCYRPKKTMDLEKIDKYIEAWLRSDSDVYVDPYIRENIPKDFEHLWYNKSSFQFLRKPSIDDIVDDSMGKSLHPTRQGKYFGELEKGNFCEMIADYNVGDSPLNEPVADKCREKLRRFTVFGINF